MKKFYLSLLALAVAISMSAFAQNSSKSGSSDSVTVSGWVTDSACGAKGAHAGAEACAKKCIAAGKSVVFVDDKEKKVWAVSNPEILKGHEGEHVDINAHVNTDTNTVDIQKVTASPEPAAKS